VKNAGGPGGASRRSFIGGAGVAIFASSAIARGSDDLHEITQALADALAPGRAELWLRWTHPDFVISDENGARIERKQFLSDMRPLPLGASGTLKVVDFFAKRIGDTQVTTYALDELERYHGEELRARYRQTDTWIRTTSGWRLIAAQVIALRTDPPAVELSAKLWDDYAGRYRLPDGLELEIAANGGSATLRKSNGMVRPLKAELADLLFIPGEPRIRYLIGRDTDGRVVRLMQRRESWDLIWDRVS
jgi:Domain of unknown function (DUF4440)